MFPPVRFSRLKAMAQSPLHYQYGMQVERPDTVSLRLGRAVDSLIFGTMRVAGFDGDRRGKEWKAFEEANAGAICLNRAESERVRGMVAALKRHADAMTLLDGTRQRTLQWSISGRDCQGTPDSFTDRYLTELKTDLTSHPERFIYRARRFAYNAQLAWYRNGLVQSGHACPAELFIVAVESTPPYPVTVFELTDRALDEGNRTWRLWFERLRASEESNAWPPYAEGIVPFDVPEEESGFSLRIGGEDVEIE